MTSEGGVLCGLGPRGLARVVVCSHLTGHLSGWW